MTQIPFSSNPNRGNTRAIPGAVFNFLATGEQTGGSFSLIRIEVQKGAEPPEHTHTNEDESYLIIEGEIKFWIGGKVFDAKAGDFIFLPRGISHRFEIQSERVIELMWLTPSGLDKWFWDNSEPAPDGYAKPMLQGPPPAELVNHFVTSLDNYGVKML
jgi:quercetin dioxygenase-like cupin family protein